MATLKVKVIPKSNRTELAKPLADGTLKVKIKAAPEKNKANEELIRFLSDHFGVSKENIRIVRGHTSSLKIIDVQE